jgi:hypothetical protein
MLGKREIVIMTAVNILDNIRRDLLFIVNYLLNKQLRDSMRRNKELKGIHKNKRCFIIGNGPSLKKYDLNRLSNEFVFSVNYLMKSELFRTIKPDYHFLFDPNLFTKENINQNLKVIMTKTLEVNDNIKFFIPYKYKNDFSTAFPNINTYYIYNNRIPTRFSKSSYMIHKNSLLFHNVVIYSISLALYMGFKEVYLLGVDMTGFLEHFEYNKTNNQWGHVYEKTETELKRIKISLKNNSYDNEFYLKTYGKTFEHFKYIKKVACYVNAKIYNASDFGALDVFERRKFEDLFRRKGS